MLLIFWRKVAVWVTARGPLTRCVAAKVKVKPEPCGTFTVSLRDQKVSVINEG